MIAAMRPSLDDLRLIIAPKVASALTSTTGFGSIAPLKKMVGERDDLAVLDGVEKLLVWGADGRPAAVVLVSSPKAPGLVARGMQRAREAKMLLGPQLGQVILSPLCEGEAAELSFAALPHCQPLSNSKLIALMQRRRLRPVVLTWLRDATALTAAEPPPDRIESAFVRPLRRLAEDVELPAELRELGRNALERLDAGAFSPRQVLMHNDLWLGNILIDDRNVTGRAGRAWAERFVIIDWPGAVIEGYGFYDLLRFAQTIKLSGDSLAREVRAHCGIFGCEPADARSHLSAALGWLLINLEHFPKPAFARTAMGCLTLLDGVLPPVTPARHSALRPKAETTA